MVEQGELESSDFDLQPGDILLVHRKGVYQQGKLQILCIKIPGVAL